MSRRHLLMLVALAAIWGSSFMFIEIALRDLSDRDQALGHLGAALKLEGGTFRFVGADGKVDWPIPIKRTGRDERRALIEHIPAVVLLAGGEDTRIRFLGAPAGFEAYSGDEPAGEYEHSGEDRAAPPVAEDEAYWAGVRRLYRLDPDGSVRRMLSKVSISNGIDWSPDNKRMYYCDLALSRIDALLGRYSYDIAFKLGDMRWGYAAAISLTVQDMCSCLACPTYRIA